MSTNHQGSRPVLVIGGREPGRISTFRQPLAAEQIVVENCTYIRLRINGIWHKEKAPQALATVVSREMNADIDLVLVNSFDEVATPIQQSYSIRLRIPAKEALDAVDHAFIRHLANGTPHMSQVAAFLKESCCQGVVNDYADGLSSYIRGLLVKDQAVGTGVTLRPAESDDLYGAALEVLKDFERPLSVVVCGLVRLAFNDFSVADKQTGFHRLDRCNSVLAPLSNLGVPPAEDSVQSTSGSTVRLCPFDQVIDRILDLSERLARQPRWGPTLLEDCRQAAEAQTFAARDRVKVLALWAAAAMRLNAKADALEPLRQLRATPAFGVWASRHLDAAKE